MVTTTQPNLVTPTPNPSDLDAQLKALCDIHGLSAVGKALAHQHGRTRAIAAVLGQLQDATSSISISPSPLDTPASTI